MNHLTSAFWLRDYPEVEFYQNTIDYGEQDHNETDSEVPDHKVESWSLLLYLICFLLLILFFVLISVMEVCCRRTVLNIPAGEDPVLELPPPYDLFGPPTYDSLHHQNKKKRKSKFNIFVIHLAKRKSTFSAEADERQNSSAQDDVSPPHPP